MEQLTEPDLELDYCCGTSGTYHGFDRFGRTTQQLWYDDGASEDRAKYLYVHERSGALAYRENAVASGLDEQYTNDSLGRLTSYDPGTLSGSHPDYTGMTNKTRTESWTLSDTENWIAYQLDADADGDPNNAGDLNQDRLHNLVNEIYDDTPDAIDELAGQAEWEDPDHDAHGNMNSVPQPMSMTDSYDCTYDAWNRLVEVKDGETSIAKYEYDGLNRRVKKCFDSDAPGDPNGLVPALLLQPVVAGPGDAAGRQRKRRAGVAGPRVPVRLVTTVY